MNMTRFSFVICLMAISTACLQAVVLPKTSYVDMPIEGVYDDYGFSAGSYVYSASPFYALGSYETCTNQLPNVGACEDCCDSSFDPYNNPDFSSGQIKLFVFYRKINIINDEQKTIIKKIITPRTGIKAKKPAINPNINENIERFFKLHIYTSFVLM